jgi:hypothetical protein
VSLLETASRHAPTSMLSLSDVNALSLKDILRSKCLSILLFNAVTSCHWTLSFENFCQYIHVCVCVCVCVFVCLCVCINAHKCTCMYVHFMHVCMYVHVYVYMYVFTYIHTYVHAYVCIGWISKDVTCI